jgi:hypothetical protein
MSDWTCALELDADRKVAAGSERALADAVRRGADLRIYTEFIHNEHIDVTSDRAERIQEVAEFGVTYLLRDSWVAGIMSLRQPIELPSRFGPRPSMSFFLYNENGQQAIARPYLDGAFPGGQPGPSEPAAPDNMPKYHVSDAWDEDTNAPSSNFAYDFDVYRYNVCDSWREVLSHDAAGAVQAGSLDALVEAFAEGCAVKVAVRDLCSGLAGEADCAHELLVEAGPCYYYTEQRLFITGSHPLIRVKPGVPLRYESEGWDFGWLVVRSDGHVVYRRFDPYTLACEDIEVRHPVRWFVR